MGDGAPAAQNSCGCTRLPAPVRSTQNTAVQSEGGTAVPLASGGFYFAGVELQDGAWLRYHLDKCRAFTQNEQEIATLGCYHMLTSV